MDRAIFVEKSNSPKYIIRPPLVFFFKNEEKITSEKNYKCLIKCKLSKSKFKWTGLFSHFIHFDTKFE